MFLSEYMAICKSSDTKQYHAKLLPVHTSNQSNANYNYAASAKQGNNIQSRFLKKVSQATCYLDDMIKSLSVVEVIENLDPP